MFGFDYGEDDEVNTTDIAKKQRTYLSNMGYTAIYKTDVSAKFAIDVDPFTDTSRMNSNVFVTNGHSGPGLVQFPNKANRKLDTFLVAESPNNTPGRYSFKNIDMSNCKAALFYGCETALSGANGSLIERAYSNGADCAFGWKKTVDTIPATKFREEMFYYMSLGDSVTVAAKKAKSEMPWFDATRSYQILGDTTLFNKSPLSRSKTNYIIHNEYLTQLPSEKDYRKIDENTFALYIDGIPTSDTLIEENGFYYKREQSFTDEQINTILTMSSADNRSLVNKNIEQSIKVDNVFYKNPIVTDDLNVWIILNGIPTLVNIKSIEYISGRGLTYLEVECTSVYDGRTIQYDDILEEWV